MAWVRHMEQNGFKVVRKDVFGKGFEDVKQQNGVPRQLFSCHTGLIAGYVIEGHVPADIVKRLLKEKPAVVGLAVPGMPEGSPGMEGPNPQRYVIYSFDKQGRVSVYDKR